MTQAQLLQHRLSAQQLTSAGFHKPAELVAHMGAIQAQDYAAAKWAVGLRVPDTTDKTIEDAFNKGEILRTHVLRPTWHFVAPADIRWMLQLTAPRVHAGNAFMYRKMELNDAIFKKSSKLLTKSLKDNNYLTRPDLQVIFNKAGIVTHEERMVCMMMHAELEGLICSGLRIGKQFSYALLEEWVAPVDTITKEEALVKLAYIYFSTRGPASLQDFVWWSGLTATDARAGIELNKKKLEHEIIDSETYWFSADTKGLSNSKNNTFLIPNFDEYPVSYKDRNMLYNAAKLNTKSGPLMLLGNLIVVEGQMVGIWKRTIKKDRVEVTLTYLQSIAKAKQKAVIKAADRYAAFQQLPLVILESK